ncbi:hypothetical protein GCM10023145_11210 [Angustibacter luteus]
MESLRRVTSDRAARLVTYDSSAAASSTAFFADSLTRGDPDSTRPAVARDTPAKAATDSSVGRPGAPL